MAAYCFGSPDVPISSFCHANFRRSAARAGAVTRPFLASKAPSTWFVMGNSHTGSSCMVARRLRHCRSSGWVPKPCRTVLRDCDEGADDRAPRNDCGDSRGEGFAQGRAQRRWSAERSPMWFLIIVLLNIVPGLDKVMVLNTYATSEECQNERNRIGFEMAAAYPYDRDFVIACQLSSKHSS